MTFCLRFIPCIMRHVAFNKTADSWCIWGNSCDRPAFWRMKKSKMGPKFDFFLRSTEKPINVTGHMHISWMAVLIQHKIKGGGFWLEEKIKWGFQNRKFTSNGDAQNVNISGVPSPSPSVLPFHRSMFFLLLTNFSQKPPHSTSLSKFWGLVSKPQIKLFYCKCESPLKFSFSLWLAYCNSCPKNPSWFFWSPIYLQYSLYVSP